MPNTYSDNLAVSWKDSRKTWQLINELNSRQPMKKVIADIEIEGMKISSASEMAEAFNCSQTSDTDGHPSKNLSSTGLWGVRKNNLGPILQVSQW